MEIHSLNKGGGVILGADGARLAPRLRGAGGGRRAGASAKLPLEKGAVSNALHRP